MIANNQGMGVSASLQILAHNDHLSSELIRSVYAFLWISQVVRSGHTI